MYFNLNLDLSLTAIQLDCSRLQIEKRNSAQFPPVSARTKLSKLTYIINTNVLYNVSFVLHDYHWHMGNYEDRETRGNNMFKDFQTTPFLRAYTV